MRLAAYALLVACAGCGIGPVDTSGSASEEPKPAEGEPGAGGAAPGLPSQTPPPGEAQPVPGDNPAAGAFVGAPAFRETVGPSSIDTTGKGNGHLSFSTDGNPAGRACLTCHDGAGKGGAPRFLFAGTLYTDKAATKVAVGAEVRVLGADGKGLSAYTDAKGNFFFRAEDGEAKVPATAGVRNAAVARSMANKINDGNCNQCHDATMRLSL